MQPFERSAVAEHTWQAGHEIEWDDVEILDTATDLQERKVKESVYIRLAPKWLKMNRDEGKELSPLWIRTVMNAQKNLPHEPRPLREPWLRDNMPLLRVRRRATALSPALQQLTPPEGPPPAVRRPTPTLRRSRWLAFKNCTLVVLHFRPDEDCSRAVKTVGIMMIIMFSLRKIMPDWCITI